MKAKEVSMECPSCHTRYGRKPLIVIRLDGSTFLKDVLPRKCESCGTNLVRRVKKVVNKK